MPGSPAIAEDTETVIIRPVRKVVKNNQVNLEKNEKYLKCSFLYFNFIINLIVKFHIITDAT